MSIDPQQTRAEQIAPSMPRPHPGIRTAREHAAREVDSRALRTQVADGRLVRLRRGVYAAPEVVAAHRHAEALVLHARAYDAARREPPVFVRTTAAAVHGLALWPVPDRVEVGVSRPSGTAAQGVRTLVLPAPQRQRAERRKGLTVTNLLDTLVECVRFLPPRTALVTVDSALHRERRELERAQGGSWESVGGLDVADPASGTVPPFLLDRLGEALLAVTGKGCRRARIVAEQMSALSESPGETLTLATLREIGVVLPEQQVWIGPFRVDFAWVARRVVLEFDGMVKYQGPEAERVFRREKEREAWLQARGWTVLRITWRALREPTLLAARLRDVGLMA